VFIYARFLSDDRLRSLLTVPLRRYVELMILADAEFDVSMIFKNNSPERNDTVKRILEDVVKHKNRFSHESA